MQRGTHCRADSGHHSHPGPDCDGACTVTIHEDGGDVEAPNPYCRPDAARDWASRYDPPVPIDATIPDPPATDLDPCWYNELEER
ncbi:MAG: hypothetical protein ABFE13_12010 [Phycisphaerales bacterium]